MMDLTIILTTLQNQSYFILFLFMFIEGPIITYAASFFATQGIFNIYIILILSVFGNLIPDTIFFLLGRYSRTKTIKSIFKFFRLNQSKIEQMDKRFSKYASQSIMMFKLIPGFAIPGLIFAGFSKLQFKTFFKIDFLFNFCSAVLFTLLGFYSGITISSFLRYLKLEKYILFVFLVFVVMIYFIIIYFKKHLIFEK